MLPGFILFCMVIFGIFVLWRLCILNYKLSEKRFREEFTNILYHTFGVSIKNATKEQYYKAVALITRYMMSKGRKEIVEKIHKTQSKQLYYLCMEFLLGRSLKNNLYNLGLEEVAFDTLKGLGINLEDLYELEPDAGLGNGGLGRLAACFMDSLATQKYPAMGYSLKYDYGIFTQKIVDGWQTELPDFWLPGGSIWLQANPEKSIEVKFNGHLEDISGKFELKDYDRVFATPYDMLVSGKNGGAIAKIRLWSASSPDFDMSLFNGGKYLRAVEQNAMAEVITKILYPEDNHPEGKSLRLNQQYFLVSATIQDIVLRHLRNYKDVSTLPDFSAIHLNDTHPVLSVSELMRLLLDEHNCSWEQAWNIVNKTIAYTNHTVMSEALECWNIDTFKLKLPRNYQIIREINRRFCKSMEDLGVNENNISRMSILTDTEVRMANLAVVASHTVNGVSELHSDILKNTVFKDFYAVMPDKFTNVTNGIAHRRWLCQANPLLTKFIQELIGEDFILNAKKLEDLKQFTSDKSVLDKLADIKHKNKERMAKYIKEKNGIVVDSNSIFDIQVKRLHEYKRQHLNALHILSLYQWLKENPNADFVPRTFIFGAKAAPGYYFAKQIIKFIVNLAKVINSDASISDKLKVVFLEDYKVSIAERLIPSAEISEQISLAGTEASGTSNMKFMINGAITLGTEDGANVEIHQAVGDDNIFIFGMESIEVAKIKSSGYDPKVYYNGNKIIKKTLDTMIDPGIYDVKFEDIFNNLTTTDNYMVLADFDSYSDIQRKAVQIYTNSEKWNIMSLMNIANAGRFSSDRSIKNYAKNIWHMKPMK